MESLAHGVVTYPDQGGHLKRAAHVGAPMARAKSRAAGVDHREHHAWRPQCAGGLD
jgi:hypothetical protein